MALPNTCPYCGGNLIPYQGGKFAICSSCKKLVRDDDAPEQPSEMFCGSKLFVRKSDDGERAKVYTDNNTEFGVEPISDWMKINELSDFMVNYLEQHGGLTRQQAQSATAKTCVNLLMNDDGRTLIAEAKCQLDLIRQFAVLSQKRSNEAEEKLQYIEAAIERVSETVDAARKASEEYGTVDDAKAKNVIALYGSLLSMNKAAGVNGIDSVTNASYILYAYLGGQARRIFTVAPDFESKESGKGKRYNRY